jgi:hypothetical protein
MRALLIVCVLLGIAEARNPFIPRTWPRKPPSPLPSVKTPACGYGTTAFLTPDRAESVARVEIVTTRGSSMEVKILDQLKGTTGTSLYSYSAGTCRDRLKVGATVIVMTGRGSSLAYGESVLAATDPRAPVLVSLLRARDDAARAKLASDAVASTDEALSDEAARYLLATPAVLNELGMRQKRTLFLAAKRRPTRELALALARLRLRIPAVIYEDLGLKDSVAKHIVGIVDFETERDPDALADAIKIEPDWPRQLAAFERCDRLRKTSVTLEPSRWLGDPIARKLWTPLQLESWCRGQTPPPPRPPYIRHPLPVPPPPPPPKIKIPPTKAMSSDLIPLKDPFASARPRSPYETDLDPPFMKKDKPAKKRARRGTFAGELCPPGSACKTPKWKDPSPPRKRPKAGPFRDVLCDPFDKPGCGLPKRAGSAGDLEPILKCNPFDTPHACSKKP